MPASNNPAAAKVSLFAVILAVPSGWPDGFVFVKRAER